MLLEPIAVKSGTLCRNESGWGSQGHGFRGSDDIIHKLQVDVTGGLLDVFLLNVSLTLFFFSLQSFLYKQFKYLNSILFCVPTRIYLINA